MIELIREEIKIYCTSKPNQTTEKKKKKKWEKIPCASNNIAVSRLASRRDLLRSSNPSVDLLINSRFTYLALMNFSFFARSSFGWGLGLDPILASQILLLFWSCCFVCYGHILFFFFQSQIKGRRQIWILPCSLSHFPRLSRTVVVVWFKMEMSWELVLKMLLKIKIICFKKSGEKKIWNWNNE